MRLSRRVILGICLLVFPSTGAWATDADRAELLAGVHNIPVIGYPGSLAVYGPEAFAVVAGKAPGALPGYSVMAPVVAAARVGRGRIVAFPGTTYFTYPPGLKGDLAQLYLNSVKWAAAGRTAPRVGVADYLSAMLNLLGTRGVTARAVNLSLDFSANDVLVLTDISLTPAIAARLRAYLENGGGLLLAGQGWIWQGDPQQIWQYPLNLITASAGLAWTTGTVAKTTDTGGFFVDESIPDTGGFFVDGGLPPYISAFAALVALVDSEQRKRPFPIPFYAPQAYASIRLALASMGPSDAILAAMQKEFRPLIGGDRAIPSSAKPIPASDLGARIAVALDLRRYELGVEPVTNAHPAAAFFPGVGGGLTVTRGVAFDGKIKGWHSTGLYCPPGGLVTVFLSSNAVGKGIAVRVGAHTDELWAEESWSRVPAVCRRLPFGDGDQLLVGSPLGGPLYIEVPDNQTPGAFSVAFVDAREAPYFKRGETPVSEWKRTSSTMERSLGNNQSLLIFPAPWTELAGQKVILTVPTSAIRTLADPTAVLKFWDDVVTAQDTLAGWSPLDRTRLERIVTDPQPANLYNPDSSPIMDYLDNAGLIVDEVRLRREGSVYLFNRLGQHHQETVWNLAGSGPSPVTSYLFSMFSYQVVVGVPFTAGIPDASLRDPAKRLARISAHVKSGAPFQKWKDDPMLALLMYVQMLEGFGWQPFYDVFSAYRRLAAAELPKTDEERRDQWLVRFSRAAGRNLGPFFERWGVPTSATARASILNLPVWMPADMPTP